MLKKLSMFGVIMIFAVALFLTAAPQHALAKHGSKEGRAKGAITAMDTTAGTLTINDRKGGTVTVTVTTATQLRLDSQKNVTLAMLAVGDTADARYDASTLVATRIDAKSPKSAKVEGSITAIDLTSQTVTIQPLSGAPVTLSATPATKVELDEAHATLAELQVGDSAEAKYDGQTLIASKIEATSN